MNILHSIGAAIFSIGLVFSGWLGFTPPVESPDLSAQIPQGTAIFETSLASPITISATSMTLTTNSVRGGTTLSGYNCFTLDEGLSTAEFICGSVSGTSVTSLERGIDPATGTTTIVALQFAHRRGTNVKITDFPLIQRTRNIIAGVTGAENIMSYAASVSTTSIAASSANIPNVAYVNGLAFNGAGVVDATASTKGVSELATGAEAGSSTASGSSGTLVLPASIASSTSPVSGNVVVVTQANGDIAEGFLPATRTLSSTFTASTSFTGTTTVKGYDVLNTGTGHGIYVASTTGTSTFNVPTGIKKLRVKTIGGGGNGGAGTDEAGGGGGGGGGGFSDKNIDVSGTTTIIYYVGAAQEETRFGGGNTVFLRATGGSVGVAASTGGIGGIGGIGSGGDINIGGSAGCSGGTGTAVRGAGGCGGSSALGGGGPGAASTNGGGTAGAGQSMGGAGGGGSDIGNGAAGAVGGIIIEW